MSDDPRIAALRAQIDALDGALLEQLQRRVEVARALGEVKRAVPRPLRDAPREAVVLEGVRARARDLPPAELDAVWRAIMALCLRVQQDDAAD
ncbi:MAG: chorismate mutase [Myxococcales bacterium]|nr:chorismate mutase [Myxococcales bacterium]